MNTPPGSRWLPPADEVLAIHRGIARLRRPRLRQRILFAVKSWWWSL